MISILKYQPVHFRREENRSRQHGGSGGSAGTSLLHEPGFDPELMLVSVRSLNDLVISAWVFFDYTFFSVKTIHVVILNCVYVFMVPCNAP